MSLNANIAFNDEPMIRPDHKAKKHSRPNYKSQRTIKGEKIGGGHFVFKRNNKNSRIHPSPFPFEHPNHGAALKEAERLQGIHGGQFDVLSVANCVDGESYDA